MMSRLRSNTACKSGSHGVRPQSLESSASAVAVGEDDFEMISEWVNDGGAAEVWLDGSGLVRKLALDLVSIQLVIEFYDFDADIAVDAPPPEQIAGEMPRYGSDGESGVPDGQADPAPQGPLPGEPPNPEPPNVEPEPPRVQPPDPSVEPPLPSATLPAGCPAPTGSNERVINFDGPQPMCIDPAASYAAVFDTSEGEMRFELNASDTPITVNNFVSLVRWATTTTPCFSARTPPSTSSRAVPPTTTVRLIPDRDTQSPTNPPSISTRTRVALPAHTATIRASW